MVGLISAVPQPRIDMLVRDAATGRDRRHTEYAGTVWFGGRPEDLEQSGATPMREGARIEQPFFVPDSLTYRSDAIVHAKLAVTVALQSEQGGTAQILDQTAMLAPAPHGDDMLLVQLQVVALSRVPLGVSYRVVAVARPDTVLDPG